MPRTKAIKDVRRVIAFIPARLMDRVDEVAKEVDGLCGIQLSFAEVQRIALLMFARTAVDAVKGRDILSMGELEQALISAVREGHGIPVEENKGREE